jgi:hypothetical protein
MSGGRRRVRLRDGKDGPDRRFLCAYLDGDDNLRIDGQDLGPKTASVSSDGEYEWFRTIKADDIPQLLRLLGADAGDNVLNVLEQHWCGKRAGDLEKIIRDSGIETNLVTYSG